jgi:quercetin dioxygenase-like cupin family protein
VRFDLTKETVMKLSSSVKWACRTVGAVLLAGPLASGQSVRPDAQGFIHVTPEEVTWGAGSGMQSVVIAGDPTKPGIYVLRNKFPPGQMSRPHFHNQARYVTVIKGTWWTATGTDADVFNPDKTVPLKPGSFMMHPAGAHHYDGAKDEEVIVQIIGMGPVTTTQLGSAGGLRSPSGSR